MNTYEMVAESNRIEGITRAPTPAELAEHERFVYLDRMNVKELERFVSVYQPNARLRNGPGLDVRVADHVPPRGGPIVEGLLGNILLRIEREDLNPWEAHVKYEMLHPFTDGNGRSGRALWYWMMAGNPQAQLGFLHAFYYQTLRDYQIATR